MEVTETELEELVRSIFSEIAAEKKRPPWLIPKRDMTPSCMTIDDLQGLVLGCQHGLLGDRTGTVSRIAVPTSPPARQTCQLPPCPQKVLPECRRPNNTMHPMAPFCL